MNVTEVLREAAALLRRDGWGQGLFHSGGPDGTGRHCVLGALDLAAFELARPAGVYVCLPDPDAPADWIGRDVVLEAAWRVLIAAGVVDESDPPDRGMVVDLMASWNDDCLRDLGEVMDALTVAAERERERVAA